MPRLIFLGTAAAVASETQANSHLLLLGQRRHVLIDCAGDTSLRLRRLQLDLNSIEDMVLTHFHPDHASGLPSLLMDLWLLGRKQALTIHGPAHAIQRAQQLLELFDWGSWPGLYPVTFHTLAENAGELVLDNDEFHLTSAPVNHLIPTIGLRIEAKASRGVIGYSCDTEPFPTVVELGRNAAALIHESTGPYRGHTSPAQAGEIAAEAGAASLYLTHYPRQLMNPVEMVAQAQQSFNGPVYAAQDWDEIIF